MRLFTALTFPPPIIARLEAIQQTLRARPALATDLSWTRPENLHVTLKFLGEIDDHHLDNLVAALRKIPVPPMALYVGRFVTLPSKGPVRVLAGTLAGDLQPLAKLFAAIEPTVQPLGVGREAREFKPHVTLARVRRPSLKHTPRSMSRQVDPFLLPTDPFTATTFTLFKSTLTPAGPVYEAVAEIGNPTSHS
ncbi:MAG: RNA 2',3'-cyclic phosphodiesterase [Phycisphaerae bacterium]|nr:RNA 2',3'-cyclic phosphodiesterase [Tepidisphaeraceae bacterium]